VLNVVCGIGNMRYEALLKGTVPFLIAEVIVLFLLVIFPDLVTVPAQWFAH
jgi:TRAP-type C4-dicarboxylate transport system permease large subunit